MSDILGDYLARFGELPPLYMTMTYDDEWYQKKMAEAIKSGKPINMGELDEIKDADLVVEGGDGGEDAFKSFGKGSKAAAFGSFGRKAGE